MMMVLNAFVESLLIACVVCVAVIDVVGVVLFGRNEEIAMFDDDGEQCVVVAVVVVIRWAELSVEC